jgi:hypothetical protein
MDSRDKPSLDPEPRAPLDARQLVQAALGFIERDLSAAAGLLCPTGFGSLDRHTGGLAPDGISLLAARPGMGASSLALQIAVHQAAGRGRPVLYCSLDAGPAAFGARLLGLLGGAALHPGAAAALHDADWAALQRSAAELAHLPLHLSEARRPAALQAQAAALQQRPAAAAGAAAPGGLGLLVIDPVERLLPRGPAARARAVVRLQRKLGCALLLLGRLDAAVDERLWDHSPRQRDLRPLEELEQQADLVLLLHRDAVYDPSVPEPRVAELTVTKNRHGLQGVVRLGYQPDPPRFHTLGQPPPAADEAPPATPAATRAQPAARPAPPGDIALVACREPGGLAERVVALCLRHFPDGFRIEQLRARLDLIQRDMLQAVLEEDLRAVWAGPLLLRRFGQTWHWADLSATGPLDPRPAQSRKVLLDDADPPGLDFRALLALLRLDPLGLMSWGDGTLSDGHWLLRCPSSAPEPRGLLELRFDMRHPGARRSPGADPQAILDPSGARSTDLERDPHGRPVLFPPTRDLHWPSYRLTTDHSHHRAAHLDALLAIHQATPTELDPIRLLTRPETGPLLLERAGEVVAALTGRPGDSIW